MIKSTTVWENSDKGRGIYLQFTTRSIALGYSFEFGNTLFVFLGCFVLVLFYE